MIKSVANTLLQSAPLMPNVNALVQCQMPFLPKAQPCQIHIKNTEICIKIWWRLPDNIASIVAE